MSFLKKIVASEHEHTDEMEAMTMALELINDLFMKLPNPEETALREQKNISEMGDGTWDKADLIDALTQAVYDYKANAR